MSQKLMNGWLRLWIFVSLIWIAIVIAIAPLRDAVEHGVVPDSWVIKHLEVGHKQFYTNLRDDEVGPMFEAVFNYRDGSNVTVRMPVVSAENIGEMREQLALDARAQGKTFLDSELEDFVKTVSDLNEKAKLAAKDYDLKKSLEATRRTNAIRDELMTKTALWSFCPPLILLFLGVGIAWVRRGFRS